MKGLCTCIKCINILIKDHPINYMFSTFNIYENEIYTNIHLNLCACKVYLNS